MCDFVISDKVNIREIVEGHRAVVAKINVIISVDKCHNSVSRLVLKPFAPNYQLKYLLETCRLSRHSAGILYFLLLSTRHSWVSRFQLKPELFERKLRKEWKRWTETVTRKLKSRKFMMIIPIRAFSFRSKRIRMSFVAAACAWLNISKARRFLELKKSKLSESQLTKLFLSASLWSVHRKCPRLRATARYVGSQPLPYINMATKYENP